MPAIAIARIGGLSVVLLRQFSVPPCLRGEVVILYLLPRRMSVSATAWAGATS
jgi:hypothetical protein